MDTLEPFEIEMDRHWTRHIKKVLMALVVIVIGYNIITSNLSLIGTEKSQKSDFSSNQELSYPIDQLYDLVELNFFANMSSKTVAR